MEKRTEGRKDGGREGERKGKGKERQREGRKVKVTYISIYPSLGYPWRSSTPVAVAAVS